MSQFRDDSEDEYAGGMDYYSHWGVDSSPINSPTPPATQGDADPDIQLVPLKGDDDDLPPSPFKKAQLSKRPPSPHPNVKNKPRRSTTPLDPALSPPRLSYAQKEKWVASPASSGCSTRIDT